MVKLETYKGYEIWSMGSGFTVEYTGDELYFTTIKEAKEFIDSL